MMAGYNATSQAHGRVFTHGLVAAEDIFKSTLSRASNWLLTSIRSGAQSGEKVWMASLLLSVVIHVSIFLQAGDSYRTKSNVEQSIPSTFEVRLSVNNPQPQKSVLPNKSPEPVTNPGRREPETQQIPIADKAASQVRPKAVQAASTVNTATAKTQSNRTSSIPERKTITSTSVNKSLLEQPATMAKSEIQLFETLPLLTNPGYLEPPAPPKYPRLAKRRNQQGLVLVLARISKLGEVDEVRLQTSSGFESLDLSAIEATHNWKFVPAQSAGETIAAWVQVPVRFTLTH